MLRIVIIFMSLLFACLTSALAKDVLPKTSLNKILGTGVLKIGSTGDYKPLTFKDPVSGKFSGFDIDQAKSLAAALGVKLEIVQTSWLKMMKDFDAGKFDVAMGGVSITLDRQKKGFFSIPYMRGGSGNLYNEDKWNIYLSLA